MVPFVNVTVSVAPKLQATLSDSTLDNVALGTPVTGVKAYLEELTSGEAFQTFGVELRSPALIQFNVADAKNFNPGGGDEVADSQVTVTAAVGTGSYVGRSYTIKGRGDWHDDGLPADHVLFLLDRMTYPLPS